MTDANKTEDIASRVHQVIAEGLSIPLEEVQAVDKEGKSKNFSDLGADSLDLIELVMAFEEKFEISIPDEEAQKIVSVADAVSAVTEKVGTKA